MIPELNGIDHIHVYVTDRNEAANWCKKGSGFQGRRGSIFTLETAFGAAGNIMPLH
jgi:hypothetical protein